MILELFWILLDASCSLLYTETTIKRKKHITFGQRRENAVPHILYWMLGFLSLTLLLLLANAHGDTGKNLCFLSADLSKLLQSQWVLFAIDLSITANLKVRSRWKRLQPSWQYTRSKNTDSVLEAAGVQIKLAWWPFSCLFYIGSTKSSCMSTYSISLTHPAKRMDSDLWISWIFVIKKVIIKWSLLQPARMRWTKEGAAKRGKKVTG